jgi:NRPS condensation-like uncharacterized protein
MLLSSDSGSTRFSPAIGFQFSKQIVERELVIVGVHQFKDIFSIVQTIYTLGMIYCVWKQRRSSERPQTRGRRPRDYFISAFAAAILDSPCVYPSKYA